jgi:arylformamidase
MATLVDLSHTIAPDIPRFASLDAPYIGPLWTHAEATTRGYRNTTCEATEVSFPTSIGTYLDAPYHFDPCGADISQLRLTQLVLPGVAVDWRRQAAPGSPLPDDLPDGLDVAGKAVIVATGWSDYWHTGQYYDHPFLARALAERLLALRPALVGIDTLVIDNPNDPERPTHTILLRAGILIVENLTGLSALIDQYFTFFAVPVKVAGATSFPVRAFAMLERWTGLTQGDHVNGEIPDTPNHRPPG